MEILNITNGSATLSLMEAAHIHGEKFSWDDILHEGPVPACTGLAELSRIRGDYIISQGYAEESQVRHKFSARDNLLERYHEFQKVVLWFEHDLYDQLQLVQLLDWFNRQQKIQVDLRIIAVDKFLGHHSALEILSLEPTSRPVSRSQLLLASQAWRAFTSNTPRDLNPLLRSSLEALPFLKSALVRLAMEYPDSRSGLPLTETLILRSLINGQLDPVSLFQAYSESEKAQFMGDSTFWLRLNQMAFCDYPLVAFQKITPIGHPLDTQQKIIITPYGREALASKNLWFEDNKMSKWVGGCHITPENSWRFNVATQQLEYIN